MGADPIEIEGSADTGLPALPLATMAPDRLRVTEYVRLQLR